MVNLMYKIKGTLYVIISYMLLTIFIFYLASRYIFNFELRIFLFAMFCQIYFILLAIIFYGYIKINSIESEINELNYIFNSNYTKNGNIQKRKKIKNKEGK